MILGLLKHCHTCLHLHPSPPGHCHLHPRPTQINAFLAGSPVPDYANFLLVPDVNYVGDTHSQPQCPFFEQFCMLSNSAKGDLWTQPIDAGLSSKSGTVGIYVLCIIKNCNFTKQNSVFTVFHFLHFSALYLLQPLCSCLLSTCTPAMFFFFDGEYSVQYVLKKVCVTE